MNIASAAVAGALTHAVVYSRLHETGDVAQEVRVFDGQLVCRALVPPAVVKPKTVGAPAPAKIGAEGKTEERPASAATTAVDMSGDSKRNDTPAAAAAPPAAAVAPPASVSLNAHHMTIYGNSLDRSAMTSLIYQCLHPIRARKIAANLSKEDLATVRRT